MKKRFTYKRTKFASAKVIVTALYNLSELVTEKNTVAWKAAKKLTRRSTTEQLEPQYQLAHKILNDRIKSA